MNPQNDNDSRNRKKEGENGDSPKTEQKEGLLVSHSIILNEYTATTFIPQTKLPDGRPLIRTHIRQLKRNGTEPLETPHHNCPIHNNGSQNEGQRVSDQNSETSSGNSLNPNRPRGSTEANRQRRQREREHKLSRLRRQGKLKPEEPVTEPKPQMPNPLRSDTDEKPKNFPTPDLYIYRTEIQGPDSTTFIFNTCSKFPRCLFLKTSPLKCNCYCRIELSVANYRRFMMTEYHKHHTPSIKIPTALPYLDLPDVFDDNRNRALVRRKNVPPIKLNMFCKAGAECMKPYVLNEPRPCGCYERTMAMKFETVRPKTSPPNDWKNLIKGTAQLPTRFVVEEEEPTPVQDMPESGEVVEEIEEDYDDEGLNTDERADSSGEESYTKVSGAKKGRKKKKAGKKRRK